MNVRARKLEEQESARAQDEHTPPTHSVLLPLPEIPPALPTGLDDGSADMFKNFRRLGLAYLDENGEQLEFSAGTVSDDDEDRRTRSEDAETIESSDSESDTTDQQFEWAAQDGGLKDYWPYPSKTVSNKSRATCNPKLTR